MINLSVIKDLCQKEGISVRKLAEKIDVKPSSLQSAIDNNSTTLVNLEKIANYFGVSVGVFFGEKTVSQNEMEKSKQAQKMAYSKVQGASSLLLRMLKYFVSCFVENVKNYYAGNLNVIEEEKKIIGKNQKYKRQPTKREFIEDWLDLNNDENDYLYQHINCLITEYWKLNDDDFVFLQSIGVVNKEQCLIMGLWAKAKYNDKDFLNLYESYQAMKSITDAVEKQETTTIFDVDIYDDKKTSN